MLETLMQLERRYGEFMLDSDEHILIWRGARMGMALSHPGCHDNTDVYWLDIFRDGEETMCLTLSLEGVQNYLDYFFKYARA